MTTVASSFDHGTHGDVHGAILGFGWCGVSESPLNKNKHSEAAEFNGKAKSGTQGMVPFRARESSTSPKRMAE